jgi:hypothetical protein
LTFIKKCWRIMFVSYSPETANIKHIFLIIGPFGSLIIFVCKIKIFLSSLFSIKSPRQQKMLLLNLSRYFISSSTKYLFISNLFQKWIFCSKLFEISSTEKANYLFAVQFLATIRKLLLFLNQSNSCYAIKFCKGKNNAKNYDRHLTEEL